MEVSFEVHKVIKFTICNTVFLSSGEGVDEVVVNRTNYQGCQFDLHFIQCQTSTDISRIMKAFVQYVQIYFPSVYISI